MTITAIPPFSPCCFCCWTCCAPCLSLESAGLLGSKADEEVERLTVFEGAPLLRAEGLVPRDEAREEAPERADDEVAEDGEGWREEADADELRREEDRWRTTP